MINLNMTTIVSAYATMASTNFPVDISQNHRCNQETLQDVSLLFRHRETQNAMPFSRDKSGNGALAQSTENNYHRGRCSGESLSCYA